MSTRFLILGALLLVGCGGAAGGGPGGGENLGGAPGTGGSDASGGETSSGGSSGGMQNGTGGMDGGPCEHGDTRTTTSSCGTNGNGFQVQECVEGEWVDRDCDNRFVSRNFCASLLIYLHT